MTEPKRALVQGTGLGLPLASGRVVDLATEIAERFPVVAVGHEHGES